MSLLTLLIGPIITLVVTGVCALASNALYQTLDELIDFLKKTMKPMLVASGESDKARLISLKDLPQLEKWFNECSNYGLINLIGLVLILLLLGSVIFYNEFPYIFVLLNEIFLGVNIVFLPVAIVRLMKTITINNNYAMLMQAFEQVTKQETNTDGSKSTSGIDGK